MAEHRITMKAIQSRQMPREYALTSGGRAIGVLRPRAIVFGALDSLEDARAAAGKAAAALGQWCHERGHVGPPAIQPEPTELELIVFSGETPVGRLLRPGNDPAVEAHGFTLEIPPVWVATGLGLAQRIYLSFAQPVAFLPDAS